MNGLQLINLLTGQQPGQASGANGAGLAGLFGGSSASGDGSGGEQFQATLGGLLTSTAAQAGTFAPGAVNGLSNTPGKALGVGLFGPTGEINAAHEANAANALLVAEQATGTEGVSGEVGVENAEIEANSELDDLLEFDVEGANSIAPGGQTSNLAAEASAASNSGSAADIAKAAAAGDKLLGADKAGKASKSAALQHVSPTAVAAVLASAAISKKPVFAADAAAGTGETSGDVSASTTGASSIAAAVLAPTAAADAAARQAAALKGGSTENTTGQENESGFGSGAEHGADTGLNSGTGDNAGSGTNSQNASADADLTASTGNGEGNGEGNGLGGEANNNGQIAGVKSGGKAGGGASVSPHLGNAAAGANVAAQDAPGLKIAAAAIAIDRTPQNGAFAMLDSGVSDDPYFGFQTSTSSSSAPMPTAGFGAAQPGGVSLASATGASQPGAAPSFVQTPHAASEQVGLQVTRAVVNGDSEFTVRLNPKELGRVEARIEFTADRGVRAYFVAESRETLALLQKDSHHLERALADAGIDPGTADLNFSLKQNGEGQADGSFGGDDRFGDDEIAGEEMPEMDVTDQIVRQVISDTAVDITI